MTPLRKEREKRRITAVEVAAGVGITQSHYSKIEACKASASPGVARKLAHYFGNAVTEHQVLYPGDYMTSEVKAS